MTRDEILNMPAGRDMDALIAEKVMGVKVVPNIDTDFLRGDYGKDGTAWTRLVLTPTKFHPNEPGYREEPITTYEPIDHYSTNLYDAWEVVDKIYIHSLRRIINEVSDKPALWQAFVYADSALSGIGETPELAICRAALLAVLEQS